MIALPIALGPHRHSNNIASWAQRQVPKLGGAYSPKADRMVRSFRPISSYSAAASLPSTMPQPP